MPNARGLTFAVLAELDVQRGGVLAFLNMKSPSDFEPPPELTAAQEGQVEYIIKMIEDFFADPNHASPRNFVKVRMRTFSTPSGQSNISHGVGEPVWAEVIRQAKEAGWNAYDDNIGDFICKRP